MAWAGRWAAGHDDGGGGDAPAGPSRKRPWQGAHDNDDDDDDGGGMGARSSRGRGGGGGGRGGGAGGFTPGGLGHRSAETGRPARGGFGNRDDDDDDDDDGGGSVHRPGGGPTWPASKPRKVFGGNSSSSSRGLASSGRNDADDHDNDGDDDDGDGDGRPRATEAERVDFVFLGSPLELPKADPLGDDTGSKRKAPWQMEVRPAVAPLGLRPPCAQHVARLMRACAWAETLCVTPPQVVDEKGRRRFHGAFTGGFSAGYFNTVGSKEGPFHLSALLAGTAAGGSFPSG